MNQREMTAAEFRLTREFLGVTGEWLASRFGKDPRQVRRWEAGTTRIPAGIAAEMQNLVEVRDAFVDAVVERLQEDGPDADQVARVIVFGSNESFFAEHPDSPWTARWHRSAMFEVARRLPWVQIDFARFPVGPMEVQ